MMWSPRWLHSDYNGNLQCWNRTASGITELASPGAKIAALGKWGSQRYSTIRQQHCKGKAWAGQCPFDLDLDRAGLSGPS